MKIRPNKIERTFGSPVLLLLLAIMLLGLGCDKNTTVAGSKGDEKATWAFWEIIQAPPPRNILFSRMADAKFQTDNPQDVQSISLLMQQMAQTCRQLANQITSAQVAGVDIDAANYGIKKSQMLIGYAKLFDSVAQLAEKQNSLTSGQDWLLGYLSALARHSDEGDEAWWNAGKEELVDKAKTFGNLEVEGQAVTTYAQKLGEVAAQLETEEMQTRVALAQRYGKEFPTAQSLADKRPTPKAAVLSAEKLQTGKQLLMAALIGRKVTTPATGAWTFDTIGEFQTFNVLHGTNYGDVQDFEVTTHVKGYFSGAEHNFRLLLTFQRSKDDVRLMFVKPLQPLSP